MAAWLPNVYEQKETEEAIQLWTQAVANQEDDSPKDMGSLFQKMEKTPTWGLKIGIWLDFITVPISHLPMVWVAIGGCLV